jgi:hypothetical protein
LATRAEVVLDEAALLAQEFAHQGRAAPFDRVGTLHGFQRGINFSQSALEMSALRRRK